MNSFLGILLFLQVILFNSFVNGGGHGQGGQHHQTSPTVEHGAPPQLADLKCSTILGCINPAADNHKAGHKVKYCVNFPTDKIPAWRKPPLILNTCCISDDDDWDIGGWSSGGWSGGSSSSPQLYCYCCDEIGTTCADSNCARYSSEPDHKNYGGRLSYYNYTISAGEGKGFEGGILFRKAKKSK